MRRSDRATKGKQPERLGFQRQVDKSPKTIHLEQQLRAAVLRKERLLVEEQIRELEDELRNSLELDVGFDPVTLGAELGKCSPSTHELKEREVTGEELETAEEYLRSFQANSSVRASAGAGASENTCKAGQLAAASGVGLVKQESCEDDLLIHNQDLESCQEEERQDELVMHSTARTYDKHPHARHCAKWAAKPIHFDLTGARPANRSSSGFGHLHRNLSHTKSMAFSK